MKKFLTLLPLLLATYATPILSQCNALHFDGTDDYVEVPSPFTEDTNFTIEMWFKSENSLVGSCSNSSLADFRWLLSWDDNDFGIGDCNGELRFIFRPLCPHGTALCSSLPGFAINDGEWHHVAYTKSNIETRIYIDGNFFVNFAADVYDMSGFFRLGRSGSGNVGKNWAGFMDEVRIWDYVRTEDEIQDSFNCSLMGDEPNLVTYFKADQGTASGSNASITMLNDQTTHDNHGILNNFGLNGLTSNWVEGYAAVCIPCPTPNALNCNGLHFDGTDDYVEIPSPFTGDTNFTIEMWFKSENSLVGSCSNSSLADFRWLLSWDDNDFGIGDCNGELRFIFRPLCPHGTALCSSLPGFAINDGEWHHVAYTKSNIETRIYIDGNFFVNFAADVYDMSGFFRLGRSGPGNVGKNWAGFMDEVRIWDYVRTEDEIQADYQCTLSGSESNLVLYYPANQGTPAGNNFTQVVLSDQSSNTNNGTLNNFSLTGATSNWVIGYSNSPGSCLSCITNNTADHLLRELVLFPNPTRETIYFQRNDLSQNFKIQVITPSGKNLILQDWDRNDPTTSISVTNLPNGLYVVLITDKKYGKVLAARKIIVQ